MDEWTLNDLLECSVCLERLDTSSKVLPCQHTFCKKCLEEILLTHQELRCPECRVLVDSKIEDLPPNVLLMRILEGMRNAGNPVPKKAGPVVHRQAQVSAPPQGPPAQPSPAGENNRPHAAPKQTAPKQAFARAVYEYISKEPGDLSFKKGDIIVLHRKVDAQWCQGECGGKVGVFPLSYVQVINPLRNHTATCKALYDFRMTNDEEEGCLTFHKDEIITVIRRVDENWAEGRLNDRIGIFPLTFVELNNVARALMKLSTNSQPGPSRVAPPTPTSEESTPLIPTDMNSRVSNVSTVANMPAQNNLANVSLTAAQAQAPTVPPPQPATSMGAASDSSSTASSGGSSSTTPNSSSNTSSSSSTAPSSPASPAAARPAPNPFRPAPFNMPSSHPMILQTSHITTSAHVLPTSHITTQAAQGRASGLVSPPPPRPSAHVHRPAPAVVAPQEESSATFQQQQQREKRHSFSVLTPSHHTCQNSNRHSAEILSAEPTPASSGEQQLTRHGSQRHRRSGSDLAAATHLPATYVALYPYKPQKQDELELKKGGVYLVTERCQDGWFKGTSNRTQKCGVFPGNYVTLAKPIQCSQSRVVASSPRDTSTPPPDHKPHHKTRSAGLLSARAVVAASLAPPELPPRAASPTRPAPLAGRPASAISASWHGDATNSQGAALMEAINKADSSVGRHAGSLLSTAVSPPPNVSVAAATPTKIAEKGKEKKEKSSLMKRLTGMKRSKSPPSAAAYSMDNPVFDDTPSLTASPSHPVHSRSGSCPTQLLQLRPDGSPQHRLLSASASVRVRHKDRPSLAGASFASPASRQAEGGGAASQSGQGSHRKSNSLDAGDARKPRQLVPPVRERFRCIVAYPPNSEHELELRVGDIIYVHRKREDGWYKGTQQRTGQTGLFPASFVETY